MEGNTDNGFTLIEISIVLVIIGLLIGGIIVGMDLINAARIRAQISQIEKYQTAVNTFKVRYRFLPGDIPDPDATNLGLKTRGLYAGEGDGNDVIEGVGYNGSAPGNNSGFYDSGGETIMFWSDMTYAKGAA